MQCRLKTQDYSTRLQTLLSVFCKRLCIKLLLTGHVTSISQSDHIFIIHSTKELLPPSTTSTRVIGSTR